MRAHSDRYPNGKYLVVPLEKVKWDPAEPGVGIMVGGGYFLEPDLIEDAVVIRLQDTFASAALSAYASSIAIAVNILKDEHSVTPERIEELQDTADFFHLAAVEAAEMAAQKLPD